MGKGGRVVRAVQRVVGGAFGFAEGLPARKEGGQLVEGDAVEGRHDEIEVAVPKRRGEEVAGGFAAHRAARDDEAEPLGILMLEAVVRVPGGFGDAGGVVLHVVEDARVDAREDDARDVVVGGEFRDDLARQLLHARLGRVEDAVFHPAGIFCRGGGGGQAAGSDRVGGDDRVDLDAPLLAFVDEVAERVKKGEGALFAGEIGARRQHRRAVERVTLGSRFKEDGVVAVFGGEVRDRVELAAQRLGRKVGRGGEIRVAAGAHRHRAQLGGGGHDPPGIALGDDLAGEQVARQQHREGRGDDRQRQEQGARDHMRPFRFHMGNIPSIP